METILFRCGACQTQMRVPAERAGRKGKCPKCGGPVEVPSSSSAKAPSPREQIKAGTVKSPAPPPSAPPPPVGGEEGYQFLVDPNEEIEKKKKEQEAEEAKRKKKKKDENKVKKRRRKLTEIKRWQQVRQGVYILFFGACVWCLSFCLDMGMVLYGASVGPEYTNLVDEILLPKDRPPPVVGQMDPLNIPDFAMALIVGAEDLTLGRVLRVLACVCALLTWGMMITGYIVSLNVPLRKGSRYLLYIALGLAGFNLLANFFFRFLPMVGAYTFTFLPYFQPEIPTVDANIERFLPLHIFWSWSPFWEIFLSLLLWTLYFLEPVLVCVFLYVCGELLREENLKDTAEGLRLLCLGAFFAFLSFHMMSLTGTTDVAITLLRVLYMLFGGLFLFFQVRFALGLFYTVKLLDKRIEDEFERRREKTESGEAEDDEDEEDDEEEEEENRRKPRPEEEEEEEEEEDDDDDDEDEKPRRRRR